MLHMLHQVFIIVLAQIVPLPQTWGDLVVWLALPAVMGFLAPSLAKAIVNLWPAKLTQYLAAITFLSYVAIAFFSVALGKVPPDVQDQLQPFLVAFMAALAAFLGDKVSTAVGSFLVGAARTLKYIGLRLAFGTSQAHQVYLTEHPHG